MRTKRNLRWWFMNLSSAELSFLFDLIQKSNVLELKTIIWMFIGRSWKISGRKRFLWRDVSDSFVKRNWERRIRSNTCSEQSIFKWVLTDSSLLMHNVLNLCIKLSLWLYFNPILISIVRESLCVRSGVHLKLVAHLCHLLLLSPTSCLCLPDHMNLVRNIVLRWWLFFNA